MRNITLLLTICVLSSCGTGIGVRKRDFVQINHQFKATLNNNSSLTKGRSGNNASQTFLAFFELYQLNADTVRLHFDSNNRLVLTFLDGERMRTETFDGTFHKKGYYEIYIRNTKRGIPILYSARDIKRLRIGLTNKNELVVDDKWARDGNIFLLAGGGSGRYRSYFKLAEGR